MNIKTLITSFIALVFSSNLCLANCDWKTGITPATNNTFIYSQDCNKEVGLLVEQNKVQTQQIADYVKAIQLKDLALTASDNRATLWNNTSQNLEDRLQKIDITEKHNEFIFFGLGILSAVAVGYGVAKLTGH
jgi:hypothetical protein